VPIYAATCEEAYRAAIFVGALGASGYAYAEATRTASLPNWLGSHVRMLTFYAHASTILVPDNPRVGVTKADRYEPELQRSYEEMAAHYSIAVIPARSPTRRPGCSSISASAHTSADPNPVVRRKTASCRRVVA
jgi:transposase